MTADAELTDQNVDIKRRTVDPPLARLVEEIALRIDRETHRETISDTVRCTEVEIDRDDETTRR